MMGHININVIALYSSRSWQFSGRLDMYANNHNTSQSYKSREFINGRDHIIFLQFKNNATIIEHLLLSGMGQGLGWGRG